MNKNDFNRINSTISLLSGLKDKLRHKISAGEIREISDKLELAEIRKKSLQALIVLLDFCDDEYNDSTNTRRASVMKIKLKLSKDIILDNSETISHSLLKALIPTFTDISNYLSGDTISDDNDVQTESIDDKNDITFVNAQLIPLKKLLGCSTISFTPYTVGQHLNYKVYRYMNEEETTTILNELIRLIQLGFFDVRVLDNTPHMWAISFLNQLKNIFKTKKDGFELFASKKIIHSDTIVDDPIESEILYPDTQIEESPEAESLGLSTKDSSISTTSYIDLLESDRDNFMTYFDISEEITENNYEYILEEYREHILSHETIDQFKKMFNKRVSAYKAKRSKTGQKHWMGEAMIFLQGFFKKIKEEKEESYDDSALLKKQQEDKELLRNQSIYFPQIIHLLEVFTQKFSSEYFQKTPQEIREAFVEQYSSLVLQPLITLNPELLSLSDKEQRSLSDKHRKIELYEGIVSVVNDGSDALIQRGVSQGFIFGEINDLIHLMQKIYDENNGSYTPTLK
ncbi:MAG: hypothetical protein NT085_02085 [candidate division SR1 bacterium]|nr:hypothetical protein [candidate division SR1 bacterium]